MEKNDSIFAFIDSQNLNLGVKSQGWTLDFARFRILLREKYCVEQAYIFIGLIAEYQSIYTHLQKSGFILVFKPILEYKKNKKTIIKGNVDAELVLHTMIEYPNYEKAVIVSGDGDFHCLIEYLFKKRKLAKVIVPNLHYSSLLKKFSEYIVNINFFKEKVRMR